ncbi:MAG: hypothetical protein KKH92_07885, partial [Firmicutes bacterium]|nr:hypothetical protein [Bacillota bacterium]
DKSDLDLYFVPKTKRGENLGFVFIIDGIGFDFWPISWERMERIANFDERLTAIISEGLVLYSGSSEDLRRFELLKEKITDEIDPAEFHKKALLKFKNIYEPFYKMVEDDKYIGMVRLQGVKILYTLTEVISLVNHTFIKRGRKYLKSEILAMENVPKQFEKLYDDFFLENDPSKLIQIVTDLIRETKIMLEEIDVYTERKSFKDNMKGFYEEIINNYNKIERACEINDHVTALFAAAEINIEMEWAFQDTEEIIEILPGILPAYDAKDLTRFCGRARLHHNRFKALLDRYEVEMLHFANFDGLKDYLDLL